MISSVTRSADALRHDQRQRQAVARPELSHRCRSPCRAAPHASALEHSAMMARSARDRIGEIEIRRSRDRSAPCRRLAGRAGETLDRGAVGRHDRSSSAKCGCAANIAARSCCAVSKGSGLPSTADRARRIVQSSRASPGGNDGARGHLRAAFGVDVDAVLLGIGGAGQDDIGAMCAAIAMAALIDDEGAAEPRHVDLVGAEQIDDVDLAAAGRVEHRVDIEAALARARNPDRDRRPARRRVCSTLKPFQPRCGLERAHGDRGLGGECQHRRAVGPRASAPCPRISIGRSAPSQRLAGRDASRRRSWRASRGRRRDSRRHK